MYQWGALWETCSTKKGGALSPFSSSLSDENSPAREINKPFAEWETSSKLIYRDQRSISKKTPNSENPSFFSGFLTLGHANSSALRSATRHHAVGWIGSQADQSTSGSLRVEIFQISWWILICKISEIHIFFCILSWISNPWFFRGWYPGQVATTWIGKKMQQQQQHHQQHTTPHCNRWFSINRKM